MVRRKICVRCGKFFFAKGKGKYICKECIQKRIERKIKKYQKIEERKLENKRIDSAWQPVRDAAIARDGGCKKCGSVEKMHGHHMYNFADYPSKRYDVSNVVIFCEKCHIKFHQKYGKSMNNPEQVDEFIN